VVDQIWERYGANPALLDEYVYEYDRAGNRTRKYNALNSDLNETYDYDALDRLTAWSLGGGPTPTKTWSLDSLGNDLGAGTYSAANEETPTVGSSGYDTAGNMTTLKSGKTAKYDAWNRLAEVDNGSGAVEKYEYDGAGRRVQIFSDFTGSTPGTVQDDYHIGQQVIESDMSVGGDRAGGYQYIWSPRYIDAPIFRDTLNTAGDGIVAAERVFYLSDANYNVTGLVKKVSGVWQVVERYNYTPYGVVTYRNADWTTATSSANNNTTLYTGRTLDLLTALYYYRARFYDALMERFINRDPSGYASRDENLYRYVFGSPIDHQDPSGLGWLSDCIWGYSTCTRTAVGKPVLSIVEVDIQVIEYHWLAGPVPLWKKRPITNKDIGTPCSIYWAMYQRYSVVCKDRNGNVVSTTTEFDRTENVGATEGTVISTGFGPQCDAKPPKI
jgi:RHS repeat-associated protein